MAADIARGQPGLGPAFCPGLPDGGTNGRRQTGHGARRRTCPGAEIHAGRHPSRAGPAAPAQPRRLAARIDQIEADSRRFGLALAACWRPTVCWGWAAPGMWRAKCPARCCICATICTPGAGDGDLTVRLPTGGRDEIGALVHAFNQFIAHLRQHRQLVEHIGAGSGGGQPGWLRAGSQQHQHAQRQALGATVTACARWWPRLARWLAALRPPPAPPSRRAATSPTATRAWTTPSAQCANLADGVSQAAQRITELGHRSPDWRNC